MQLEAITTTDILLWILFGLIVAIAVHFIDNSSIKGGLATTIIAGITGALLGGLLSSTILYRANSGFLTQDLTIAITFAIILTTIIKLLTPPKNHIKTIKTKL